MTDLSAKDALSLPLPHSTVEELVIDLLVKLGTEIDTSPVPPVDVLENVGWGRLIVRDALLSTVTEAVARLAVLLPPTFEELDKV